MYSKARRMANKKMIVSDEYFFICQLGDNQPIELNHGFFCTYSFICFHLRIKRRATRWDLPLHICIHLQTGQAHEPAP